MKQQGWTWDSKVAVSDIPINIRGLLIHEMEEWIADFHTTKDPIHIKWNGKCHFCGHPEAAIFTGACEYQGGIVMYQANQPIWERSFPYSKQQALAHITTQETQSGAEGVVEAILQEDFSNCCLAVCMDATASLPTLQNCGSKRRQFTEHARLLYQVTRNRRIVLQLYHIQGESNPADAPSRIQLGVKEYQLRTDIFQWISRRHGPIKVDCFAAR